MTAGMRDASWYAHPGAAARYHVWRDHHPACTPRAFLAEYTRIPAPDVPDALRCRRNGCRGRWPSRPAAAAHQKDPATGVSTRR